MRPPEGNWHRVALITLSTGTTHAVEDGDRTAARRIALTKEKVTA